MVRNGKIILSVVVFATMTGPVFADFNDTHVFNPDWPPHARYHSVMLLAVGIAMSVVALWLVWKRSPDPTTNLRVATAVPVVVWGSFFVPLLVSGTSVEDHPGETGRPLGIPLNLLLAGVFIVLAAVGYRLSVPGGERRTRQADLAGPPASGEVPPHDVGQ